MIEFVFSHGKEGSPQSTKNSALAQIAESFNFKTSILDYRSCPTVFDRLDLLGKHLQQDTKTPKILVGSSMGGAISLATAQKDNNVIGLFLMAPAINMQGYPKIKIEREIPTHVIHGWQDEIIPVQNVLDFSQKHPSTLTMYHDDHSLKTSLPQIEELFSSFVSKLTQRKNTRF